MVCLTRLCILLTVGCFSWSILAAPIIDPIPNTSIPKGKSLMVPITATSPNGQPLTFTATSSTKTITVQVHTNNPFWKMSIVQLAPSNAPGAFQTPFRGGVVTVTNVGDMTFMLFRDVAPHSVDVIQGLTESGLYTSNTIFHRVVPGFVIQGGDPMTNGLGGPVFRFDDEFNPRAMFSGNGQLALANSGKDTDGSQFFVTTGPQRFLDFGYTLFGQLLRGFNVLTNIVNTPTNGNSRPLADVIITQASFVPDISDTVLTITGTNRAGVSTTIKVVAADAAGGRTTNSFTATTAADTLVEPRFIYPNYVTNLVVPVNTRLTNYVFGYFFPGSSNNWSVQFADFNSSASASNSFFKVVTNQLRVVVVPNTNYAGPVSVIVYNGSDPSFSSYDRQHYTFAFGDTAIKATATDFIAPPLSPFVNQLLASFTNGVPNSSTTNFTALINWGDNSTNAGVILTNALGWKEVRGSHTYTNSGDYPVYVSIQSALGAGATVVDTATVPPGIDLERSGSANAIRWPAWAFEYHLLSNTNFAATTNWVPVTNRAALFGHQNVVSNITTGDRYFLRLVK